MAAAQHGRAGRCGWCGPCGSVSVSPGQRSTAVLEMERAASRGWGSLFLLHLLCPLPLPISFPPSAQQRSAVEAD